MSLAGEMQQKTGPAPVVNTGATTPVAPATAPTTEAINSDAATPAPAAAPAPVTNTEVATQAAPTNEGDQQSGASDIAPTDTTTVSTSDDGMDDAKVLEYLKKRSGKDVTSIDDLFAAPAQKAEPTEAEKAEFEQKFHADALKFGLETGLFKPSQLEAFHVENARSPRETALSRYAEEILAEDTELAEKMKTDKAGALAEIEERFQDEHFEHEEDNDPRKKRAQRRMQEQHNNYINSKYDKVINAADAFKAQLETQQNAVGYKAKVEKAFSALPTELKATIEGKEFSYKIPDNSRTELREQFLKEEVFNRLGEGAIEEAELGKTMHTALLNLEWSKAAVEFAKAHASEMLEQHKIGRKGIPVLEEGGGTAQSPIISGNQSIASKMQAEENAKKRK